MNHELKEVERRASVRYELKRGRAERIAESQHHGYYEIYYLTRGSGLYLIGGRTYNVDEGDVLLIPEGIEHKTVEADEYRERHILACRPHYVPRSVRRKFGECHLKTYYQKIKIYIISSTTSLCPKECSKVYVIHIMKWLKIKIMKN